MGDAIYTSEQLAALAPRVTDRQRDRPDWRAGGLPVHHECSPAIPLGGPDTWRGPLFDPRLSHYIVVITETCSCAATSLSKMGKQRPKEIERTLLY